MPTDQAEIVGEGMAVKFVAELSAQCTATSAAYKPAEDGARNGSEGDSERAGNSADGGTCLTAGNSADGGTCLTACKSCTDAACCTANRTDGGCNSWPGGERRFWVSYSEGTAMTWFEAPWWGCHSSDVGLYFS